MFPRYFRTPHGTEEEVFLHDEHPVGTTIYQEHLHEARDGRVKLTLHADGEWKIETPATNRACA